LYVFLSFITDSILLWLEKKGDDSLIHEILPFYTILEFGIFAFVLYLVIDNRIFKSIILISGLGFLIFSLVYLITGANKNFDSVSASLESIFVIAYCILYLFDQLNKPQVIFIYQDPNFWFVAGFMVYLSGTLFLFIQANNLDLETRDNLWKINYFANIVKNILFAIAFSTKKSDSIFPSLDSPFDDALEKESTF
jgi:hypothetical protein